MVNIEKFLSLKAIDILWRGKVLVRVYSQSVEKAEKELLVQYQLKELPQGTIIFEAGI